MVQYFIVVFRENSLKRGFRWFAILAVKIYGKRAVFLKKAQADATNAATLVAIVAALIVLYLLFLPPDIREEILEGNASNATETTTSSLNNTLLSERPGHLSYIPVTEYEHDLPAFSLYMVTNSVILKSQNPFTIRNGWFDKSFKRVGFTVNDLSNTNNVILSFRAPLRDGRLTIKLNEVLIYEGSLSEENSPALYLSNDLLQQNNVLDFRVSPVGIAFWKTNEYSFQNMQIIADVTDISRQESMSKFIISSTEKHNIEKASLKFNPDCNPNDVGRLEIFVNGIPVLSQVPDCKTLNTINIPSGLIELGENTIRVKTSKGSYLIDNIKLVTKLKEAAGAVYYFDIESEQNRIIQNTSKNAVLEIKLVKTDEIKEADIIVNGHTTRMRTSSDVWTKALQKYWLFEGSNYIKIDPKTELDVVSAKVDIKD